MGFFFSVMNYQVCVQVHFICELFSPACDLVSCMDKRVHVLCPFLYELFISNTTSMNPLSSINSSLILLDHLFCESFITNNTSVKILSSMNHRVCISYLIV